jgi:ferritin
MLSMRLQEALNDQIAHEIDSAYIYLSMVAYFEAENLKGCAHWMRLQRLEELEHAMKIFDFVIDRGGRVELHALKKPPTQYKSPLDVFQKALAHERSITGLIHKLYGLAVKENDYPTQVMLHWFIDEQVEEERIATEVVEQLKLIGDSGVGLLVLDRKLGERKAEE